MKSFSSIAPGRLCLFGEHQDYLNLPVIALALPHDLLACRIDVTPRLDSRELKLIFQTKIWSVNLDAIPPKQQIIGKNNITNDADDVDFDFALAALHEVLDDGWVLTCGADCVSTTTIPLQAGCSSSSAFCVAWIQVLFRLSNHHQSRNNNNDNNNDNNNPTTLSSLKLAQWAHRAEVTHFGSPGGTMDHVSSAVGGILRIGPGMWDYKSMEMPNNKKSHASSEASDDDNDAGVWVLAYSGEPKDTMKHLNRCKGDRLKLLEKLGGSWDNYNNNHNDNNNNNNNEHVALTHDELLLLKATLINRDMEQRAYTEWNTSSGKILASYMAEHHEALRDGLHLSTPRLEAMNDAAKQAGAWGFKVVGSGGGGCGVAWCPTNMADAVSCAMIHAGAAQTWLISGSSPGASIEECAT